VANFFAYIRVSTAKQGEGVSLAEQRDAIARYAQRAGFSVVRWFEEKETAAKRGRPVFSEMLKLLQEGDAAGVIIHKIDRSARNLRDWADLGELIDRGIDVRFASESLDLQTRGGRLSADIQAVVAADFIRNLRQETKKGMYGRFKQGLFPMPAPLGYSNRGKGIAKEIDPLKGPLVRKAFELYASGGHTLETVVDEMNRLGLRNRNGGKMKINGLSVILRNPFYMGVIRLRTTGETFTGRHRPLVSVEIFKRVQQALAGKVHAKIIKHEFLFRRLLTCKACGYSLVGELQKGHVYYRCHTRRCPITNIREETVEHEIEAALLPLQFSEREKPYLRSRVESMRENWSQEQAARAETLRLRLERLKDRLARLTDAFLDGTIEKDLFEERKKALLLERQNVMDQIEGPPQRLPELLSSFLELAGDAYVSYELGLPDEKRELLGLVTSNRHVDGKNLVISLAEPFHQVANRFQNPNGSPFRGVPRTLDKLLAALGKILLQESAFTQRLSSFFEKDTKEDDSDKGEDEILNQRARILRRVA